MSNPLSDFYRKNRTGVIAGTAVIGAAVAILQLRKPAVVIQGASDTGPTPPPVSDLGAFQAGAAAATGGFAPGAALGQGALGLAAMVVQSQGDVAQTLANSQAGVAGYGFAALSGALAGALELARNPYILQLPAILPGPTPGPINPTPQNPPTTPPAPGPSGPPRANYGTPCNGTVVRSGPSLSSPIIATLSAHTWVHARAVVSGDTYPASSCARAGNEWLVIDHMQGSAVNGYSPFGQWRQVNQ